MAAAAIRSRGMSYRQMTTVPPLIMTVDQRVIALDAATGARIWEQTLPQSARRLFLVGTRLLVAYADALWCVDVHTGRGLGSVTLGFEVSAGLVTGDRLLVHGRLAAVGAVLSVLALALAWATLSDGCLSIHLLAAAVVTPAFTLYHAARAALTLTERPRREPR